jgi:alkylhydroperoxidase/carboxymuconolactone decarboxylase family protein YurZ
MLVLSEEIGAGKIREDVQQAIESELQYRLDGSRPSGALSRKEKELLLLALHGVQLNACLSQLHARAAIRAGASVDEVAHVATTVILTGMIRWKMAGMGAYVAATQEALSKGTRPTVTTANIDDHSMKNMRAYVSTVLNRDFPDMWETLAVAAPGVLEGYMKLRQDVVRADAHSGAMPKSFIELTIATCDIVQGNDWGAQMHIRQAIRDGITATQVVEAIALAMIEGGVPVYQTGGRDVIASAEDESRRLSSGQAHPSTA